MSFPVHVTVCAYAPALVLDIGPGLTGAVFDDVASLRSLAKSCFHNFHR